MEDTREGPSTLFYQSVRGSSGRCGHRHISLVAAAMCLDRRRVRDRLFWGRERFDWGLVGPGPRPLTATESAFLTEWADRQQRAAQEPQAPMPADLGLMRRLRQLSAEGLHAAAEYAVEQVVELVEAQRSSLLPVHGHAALDTLRVLAVRIRAAGADIVRNAVTYAALKPEAAIVERGMERKGPKRAARRRREEEAAG